MKEKKHTVQIIPKESVISSVAKDTYSCLLLGAFFYFNQHFIGGSHLVNFLILLCSTCYVLKFVKTTLFKVNDEQLKKIKSILNNDKSN